MGKKMEENSKDVVVKVYMHCEGCSRKVFNCLRGFEGVEDIVIDNANQKVTVKGKNADPIKVLERLEKKYSKNVELISPLPKPHHHYKNHVQNKQEQNMKMIVVKMLMHCEGCAHDIKRNIGRMEGIMSVETDMEKSQVVIRGLFDPPKLIEKITKRLGKHVQIVKPDFEDHKKGNDQKKSNQNQEILMYSPPYNSLDFYPSMFLSDDNVFSCSLM